MKSDIIKRLIEIKGDGIGGAGCLRPADLR
jgi:hypothetical protein